MYCNHKKVMNSLINLDFIMMLKIFLKIHLLISNWQIKAQKVLIKQIIKKINSLIKRTMIT